MNPNIFAALTGVAACVIVTLIYPFVLRYAIRHNIVDNPNARKLQRTPVPVLGGVAVFTGVLPTVVATGIFLNDPKAIVVNLCSITVMLAIGVWDDRRDISAIFRFFVEILVVFLMMLAAGCSIDDFHGLWGIHGVPWYVSWPLSIVAGVGIINAINLIDGVNGYSSGYGIISCFMFAAFFFHCEMVTLMMGTAIAFFAANCLSSGSPTQELEENNFGLIAFTLAVLNIPVFDTLRVMSVRIARGLSPFHPDKTHLHHLFIDMGFSHSGTTTAILSMNILTVTIWFLSWKLGASIDLQTYIVVALGTLNTFVFYKFMRIQAERDSRIYKAMLHLGSLTHIGHTRFWTFMRETVDRMS